MKGLIASVQGRHRYPMLWMVFANLCPPSIWNDRILPQLAVQRGNGSRRSCVSRVQVFTTELPTIMQFDGHLQRDGRFFEPLPFTKIISDLQSFHW